MTEIRPFHPDDLLKMQLEANRQGRLTRGQKFPLMLMAIISSGGLLLMTVMLISLVSALSAGVRLSGLISALFMLIFLITFGYLGMTLFFNARMFIPEALMSNPVKQVRGKLQIRKPQRERPELPFSYIVGSYSFAPYVVPYEVPMDVGREYIVYYGAHTRVFLSIEPVEYQGKK